MGLLGQIGRGLLTHAVTGSPAAGLAAFGTNSLLAGFGVGLADNLLGGTLSYGMGAAWNGAYSYGGFYGGYYPLDYGFANNFYGCGCSWYGW
ncbi:MAG: hypothetical protein ACO3JL_10220 [Myxococcota bacterium]